MKHILPLLCLLLTACHTAPQRPAVPPLPPVVPLRLRAARPPPAPMRHVTLTWDASGDHDTTYRVRGGPDPTQAWTWPVLLTTNGTSCVQSNEWREMYFRVTASNANTGVEVPVRKR